MEDGCTLNMMVERLEKMATGDFTNITGGDLRHGPTLGFTSAKSSGSHGEHGSISFNMLEFSKLDVTRGDYHVVFAKVLRPPVRNTRPPVWRVETTKTPDLKPLEPAIDRSQQPSTDAERIVAKYVSNARYVALDNRTEEMAEDGALYLVNIDAVNVVKVEQDLVNNDMVNVDVDGKKDKDKDVDAVNSDDTVGFGQKRTYETNSAHTGLFVGNIPLQSCPIPSADDKIANNSSHKTLSYIPPTIQNGEIVTRPTIEYIQNGTSRWKTTAGLDKIKTYTGHLPVELWTEEGLSTVASGIDRPLYSDAITRACTRLDFARVCVMLDVSSKLPMMPNEEGGEIPCKIDVEYEWLPPKCKSCMTLGHTTKVCSFTKLSKPAKPLVSIYILKTIPARPLSMHDQDRMLPTQAVDNQREGRELPHGERLSRIPKMGPAGPPLMHDQEGILPNQEWTTSERDEHLIKRGCRQLMARRTSERDE
ncbi:UNVERIFIED_CONTAM: hypothetical protein Sindi_0724500 [Sesamum indicum]